MHIAEEMGMYDTQKCLSLWQDAAVFAAKAHKGQTCPGTKAPYFSHPARVAMLISSCFDCDDAEILAVAYLHDVLEKTAVDRTMLTRSFGETVTDWVEWVSKNAKGSKESYWERLAVAPWQARLVKMADALDHLNEPEEYRVERVRSARKALGLASSFEPEIRRAAMVLRNALDDAAS